MLDILPEPDMKESIIKRVDRFFDKVTTVTSRASIYVCAVLLVAWVGLYGVYIISRALFPLGWIFVEETTGYWVLFLALFSASYTLRTGKHINIDIVTSHLPEKVRNILMLVMTLVALVIACYITKQAVTGTLFGLEINIRSMGPLNLIQWPIYAFIPIGFSLLSLELLSHLCHSILGLTRSK